MNHTNTRNFIGRSLCLLFVALLLGTLVVLPAAATEILSFDTEYDEDKGQITVHMHDSYAEKGTVDLYSTVRETAERGASLYIDAGKVKLYLNAAAVKVLSDRNQPIPIFAKLDKVAADSETSETSEGSDGSDETVHVETVTRVRVSLGDVDLPSGSMRIRIRYTPEDPAAVRVFARYEDGRERELTAACEKAFVAFYPEDLGDGVEFLVTERPPESGTPKAPFLAALFLGAVLLASAVLLVLLKTGTLRRFAEKRFDRAER